MFLVLRYKCSLFRFFPKKNFTFLISENTLDLEGYTICELLGLEIHDIETIIIDQFFMKRLHQFMTTLAKKALEIKYYWAKEEFTPERGQIHLHLLGMGKNKTCLVDYYRAKTAKEKTKMISLSANFTHGML